MDLQAPRPASRKHPSSTSPPKSLISTSDSDLDLDSDSDSKTHTATSQTSSTRPTRSSSSSDHHSSTSTPSTPPSKLTTKMRSLIHTSHSKILSTLPNLPNLKNLNLTPTKSKTSIHTNTPTPFHSSPNGKPETLGCYEKERSSYDPLSGPTTRHAEYLFSRVNGGFLGPDTPPLGYSPSWSPCSLRSEGGEGSSRSLDCYKRWDSEKVYGFEGEGNKKDEMDERKERNEKDASPWKNLRKSWEGVLGDINGHINTHINTSSAKYEDAKKITITGQENGNRRPPMMYIDVSDEDEHCEDRADMDAESDADTKGYNGEYDVYDYEAYTEGRYGCGDPGDVDPDPNLNKLIRTRSRESFVEVLLDGDEADENSIPPTFHADSQTARRNQNQNTFSEAMDQQIKQPLGRSYSSHPTYSSESNLRSTSTGKSDSLPSDEELRRESLRIEKEVEEAVKESIYPHGNLYTPKKVGKEVVVRDFAYMEMRPKPKPKSLNADVKVDESEKGNEGEDTEDQSARNGYDNDDARSSLDLEDSMYEEGRENKGEDWSDVTRSKTVVDMVMTPKQRGNLNFNPPRLPLPFPPSHQSHYLQSQPSHQRYHPSSSDSTPPTSQALIHLPRTYDQPSPSDLSISQLSLPSSMIDSAYLRGSEMQEYLMSHSFDSIGDSLSQSEISPQDGTSDEAGGARNMQIQTQKEVQNPHEYDDDEDAEKNGVESKDEDEDEDANTETQEKIEASEMQLQLQLSPYTFPGTNLYLWEAVPKSSCGLMERGWRYRCGEKEGEGEERWESEERKGVMMHFSRSPTGREVLRC